MSPIAYEARLRTAIAAYEAKPRPSSWQAVDDVAGAIRRRWPGVVLMLPIPPPMPPKRGRGRPRKSTPITPSPETT